MCESLNVPILKSAPNHCEFFRFITDKLNRLSHFDHLSFLRSYPFRVGFIDLEMLVLRFQQHHFFAADILLVRGMDACCLLRKAGTHCGNAAAGWGGAADLFAANGGRE